MALIISIAECGSDDTHTLALLNKQLIEDEQADNVMSLPELENRMSRFLETGYRAFYFTYEGETIGYALCDTTQAPVYLRQFFIYRDKRRSGYGRASFYAMLEFIGITEIEIDVYIWNTVGTKFWKSLGFMERYTRMRFKEN